MIFRVYSVCFAQRPAATVPVQDQSSSTPTPHSSPGCSFHVVNRIPYLASTLYSIYYSLRNVTASTAEELPGVHVSFSIGGRFDLCHALVLFPRLFFPWVGENLPCVRRICCRNSHTGCMSSQVSAGPGCLKLKGSGRFAICQLIPVLFYFPRATYTCSKLTVCFA